MSRVTDQTVRKIVQSIVDEVNPEQVILFGSRARDDQREDSDVDLIVVESAPFGSARSRRMEAARLYEAVAQLEAGMDILVYSRDEMETWGRLPNHVLGRTRREGKVVHDRS